MQISRSILQRFVWNSGRSALPTSTLHASKRIRKPSIWPTQPLPAVITARLQLDCSQQILQSDKSQPTRRHRKLNHHIEMFLHTKCALLARSAWHLRPTECRNKHITMAQCWLHVLVARTDIWSLIISKYVVNNPFQSWSYALTDSRSSPTIASLWKTYWNKMVSFSSGVLSAQMGMLKFGKMGSQPENHHLWKARNLYG